MYRVFLFFVKYNGAFAFVIMEVIALSFYFTRNINPNKASFISSANGFLGGVYETSSKVSRYWNLSAVNDSLARENAELKMRLPNSKFSSLVKSNIQKDTTLKQHYAYVDAKVINNTTHRPHNFLTLNRGIKQQLALNAGVINGNGKGIVGVTLKSSDNYTVVMSILNVDTRVSAKILSNDYFGVLVWDGLDARYMTLESVPKHAFVQKGDTVVTSGFSTVFPGGILIGTIEDFYQPAGLNFYTIKVHLFNDVNNAQYVYVVENLFKEERKKLEKEELNE
jgi:rod shape-determining protein MreC